MFVDIVCHQKLKHINEFVKLYECRISFKTPKWIRAMIDQRIEQSGGEFESRRHYLSMIVQNDLAEAGVMTAERVWNSLEKRCLPCYYFIPEFVPETHCPKCGKPLEPTGCTLMERSTVTLLLDRDLPKDQRLKFTAMLKDSLENRGVLNNVC